MNGNSGPRIGCGIIGIGSTASEPLPTQPTSTTTTTTTTTLQSGAYSLLNVSGALLFTQPAFFSVNTAFIRQALAMVASIPAVNITVVSSLTAQSTTQVSYAAVVNGLVLNSAIIAFSNMVTDGTLLQTLKVLN